jgi:hypothetical protein
MNPRGPLDQRPLEPGWWIASDGRWYPPESAPAGLPLAPVIRAEPTVATGIGWWLIAGAGAIIVGSFMPWVTLTAVFVGTVSRSGVQGGDGWISIALAVPLLIFGVRAARGMSPIPAVWALVLGVVLVVFSIFELSDVANKMSSVNNQAQGYGRADVGVGLWLVLFGSAATVVGSLLAFRKRS